MFGLIDAAVNVFNAAKQRQVAKENTDKTIAANKAMAEYSYSKDLEMWNRQNEYNSPTSQMKRFKDAGLNPRLIYGNGSSSAGNASSMPQYNAPRQEFNYEPMRLPSAMGMYMDLAQKKVMIDNVREQTNLAKERQLTEVVNRALKSTQKKYLGTRQIGEMARTNLAKYQESMNYELLRYSKQFAQVEMQKRLLDLANRNEAQKSRSRDVQLKQSELNWREKGMTQNDKIQYRMAMKILEKLGFNFDDF